MINIVIRLSTRTRFRGSIFGYSAYMRNVSPLNLNHIYLIGHLLLIQGPAMGVSNSSSTDPKLGM